MSLVVFWLALLIIVFSYMSLWYGVSVLTKRLDVVDSAWGLGFVLVAWISVALRGNFGVMQIVSALLVTVWGLRLFAHIAGRNWRKKEDDPRYKALRKKWGPDQNLQSFTHIFLLQGLLLTAVSAPMIAIAFARTDPNALAYAGWVIWLGGTVFETVADRQLAAFIARRLKGSDKIMDRGLWRYSRHPNYFGEAMTWWGAAIVAVSAGYWWGIAGAALITLLVTKISGIPLLEKRYAADKKYGTYRARTSVFIPWPPKA